MMKIYNNYSAISQDQWAQLIQDSPTATWFQTAAAYRFFAEQPELFTAFVVAVEDEDCTLKGVCVGYITKEKNAIKQWLTRRAIIIGGPALAADIKNEQLSALLMNVRKEIASKAIYIETRNFNDYSKYRTIFEICGFAYEPHLNFHVDTTDWEQAEKRISKSRQRFIRLSHREGASIVENPTLEQVKDFYLLLKHLYQTKVKTPLQPWSFFERLYNSPDCRYILVEYQESIIGGCVCMLLAQHATYEWFACGSDGQYKNIFPSSVAIHGSMQYSAEHGYPIFDMMGAGKPDEDYGVRDFKARFGGQLVEHGRFHHICKPLHYKLGVLGVKLLRRK